MERKTSEDANPRYIEEDEAKEVPQKVELNKKELQSQKEQNITELNEAIMASPQEAAKLLTSYIKE